MYRHRDRLTTAKSSSPACHSCLTFAQVLPGRTQPRFMIDFSYSLGTARGPGSRISALAPDLAPLVSQVPWRTVAYMMKDACTTNYAVIAREEQAALATHADGNPDTHVGVLSGICAGHACVLCTKASLEEDSNNPANLVRLGHILASGKTWESVLLHAALVNRKFRYHHVESADRLPPEFPEWQAYTTRILDLSAGARDMRLKAADNGNWKDRTWIDHWCVLRCPLGCEGKARRSRKIVCGIIVASISTGMPVPLLYRWTRYGIRYGQIMGVASA